MPLLLYLDQNHLSGIVRRKPAHVELEPVLRGAVATGTVRVVESARESAPRPDHDVRGLRRSLVRRPAPRRARRDRLRAP